MPASWSASLCPCMVYRTEQAAPLTKISAMPQRKHCLGSATPQRNIVFLISPTRAHACLISCSGRKKNIHSRCCLSTTNQPVRLFSMLFTTSSEESRREDVGTRARSKLPATHGIHGIAWICACHCLPCLPREGMELILQLPAICARSWPSVVRQAPALYFSSSSHQSLRNVAEEEDLRVLAPTNHTLLPLGFSKDFETFCGSLFCLGFARVIRRCTSTLIRSQSLHISSTSTVLRLFHVGSRQRGQDR